MTMKVVVGKHLRIFVKRAIVKMKDMNVTNSLELKSSSIISKREAT